MTLDQVIRNLENTIQGKRTMLIDLVTGRNFTERVTAEFLEINISELERILTALKQVQEATTAASWVGNPDRSGGQFTTDEIGESHRWR
jgi:hypothetical protein